MKTTCKAKFTATRLQRRFSRELNSTPHLTRCIWPVPRPRPLIGKYFLKNIWPAKRRLQLLTDGNACGVRAQNEVPSPQWHTARRKAQHWPESEGRSRRDCEPRCQ